MSNRPPNYPDRFARRSNAIRGVAAIQTSGAHVPAANGNTAAASAKVAVKAAKEAAEDGVDPNFQFLFLSSINRIPQANQPS